MLQTADYREDEESLRLSPYQAPGSGEQQQPRSGTKAGKQHSKYKNEGEIMFHNLPLSREQRLASIKLDCWYQFLWIVLIIIIALIPIYNWLTLVADECLSARENQIISSVFIALFSGFISIVLAILNFCSRKSISWYRARLCAFCFVLFSIVSLLNFLIGIYFFAIQSCYFFINAVVDAFQIEQNIVQKIIYKYDVKISGILHLIASILAFSIGIGFAIIKNNFKYVRQIDFD